MQFRDLISRLDGLSEDTIGTVPVQLDQGSIDKLKSSNPTLYQQILRTNPELAMAMQSPVAGSTATNAPQTPGATVAQGTTGAIAPQGAPGQPTTSGNTSSQIPDKQAPVGSNEQQPMQGKRPQESFDTFKNQMDQVVEELTTEEELSAEEKARKQAEIRKKYIDRVNSNPEFINDPQFRSLKPAQKQEILTDPNIQPTARKFVQAQRQLDVFNSGKDQPTTRRDELLVLKNQALAAHQKANEKPTPASAPAAAPAAAPASAPAAAPASAPAATNTAKPASEPTAAPVAAPEVVVKPEKPKFDLGAGAWYDGKEGDYDIQKGDTLYKISKEKGVSIDDLKKFNNIDNVNKIRAGAKLKTSAPVVVPPEQQDVKTDGDGPDQATRDAWRAQDMARLHKMANDELSGTKTESIVRLDSVVEELLNEAGTATMPVSNTDNKSVWQSTKDTVGKGVDAVSNTIPQPVKDVASKVANHPVTKYVGKAAGPALTVLSAPSIPTDARQAYELSDKGDSVGAWLKGGQAALNTAALGTTAAMAFPPATVPAAIATGVLGATSLGLNAAEMARDKWFPYKGKDTADVKSKSANEELNRVLTLTQYKVGK